MPSHFEIAAIALLSINIIATLYYKRKQEEDEQEDEEQEENYAPGPTIKRRG
jgi:hypothetical protein